MTSSSVPQYSSQKASESAEAATGVVGAQNSFGAQLLERLESGNAVHQNLIASPTSLWQALALAAGGAKGETKTQMKNLLAVPSLSDEQIGAANRAFNTLLAEQRGASISVANSVWFADTFRPNPAFSEMASKNFAAGVETFAHDNLGEGAQKINGWVSEHTQKEIPQIVEADDLRGQSALLVNAVYFRGGWKTKFAPTTTAPAPFHLADGTAVQVPMMHGTQESAYLDGQSFEGARLPYENTGCALWVMLPKEGKTPTDVLKELGQESARKLRGSDKVNLSLPRFDVQWRREVSRELAQMGAPLPFSDQADFSGLGEPATAISKVIHVCKMRVDEEGTVAAAATVVGMRTLSMRRDETKKLDFDRPFVVALVEEMSGARLFEGTVYDPRS